ncbi:SDR family oxidoreductase [Burkholderia sp. JPY481]|uniref:SDR family oxidoreductase n=1 Tax=Paraburkholderia TaxID=1822464 RepID=UPI00128C7F7E|nr:SDR family oxidoreductase [Paraburkholderia atlantica]MPW04355.1 SDR family oxidoreductase [Paraburkholderia atlantica]
MKNIVIIGATSAIASACARAWNGPGVRFALVARNARRLQETADDLKARGAGFVSCHQLDIDDLGAQEAVVQACRAALGSIDIVLVAPGTLPDQRECERDAAVAVREFTTNVVSVIALLTRFANIVEEQRSGTLAVIASVAGDRGRPSNYLYGSAKAALATFCEGLNARLKKVGGHVVTIKPGFVATPMTQGLPLPKPLVATPQAVAADIVKAVARHRDVLYTPWFWAGIMLIIRSIPRRIFNRLSL